MKNSLPRSRSGRSLAYMGRYVALALCAALLTFITASSLAQRRTAIRIPAGEATPTNAPRRESRPETESEKRREAEAARARTRAAAQRKGVSVSRPGPQSGGAQVGVPTTGEMGIERTTAEIMLSQSFAPQFSREPRLMKEHELPSRKGLPQDPNAKPLSRTPAPARGVKTPAADNDTTNTNAPQTVSTQFTGATLSDTGAFPPDTMGTVGPTQFVVFVNGRIRTFDKTTGAADGVINADPDVFFSSVMTPLTGGVTINFTSDPQVRYDRLSGRWFLTIIDVPSTSSGSIGDTPNRILIAVSDAASNGTISAGTVWTFFFVQQDTVGGANTGEFLDYPSLGVDANALYIGGNMFGTASPDFITTSAFVVRKSSVLGAGPVVTTAFRQLIADPNNFDEGMLSPRGVDNYNPAATEGYFIGASDALFGELVMRRISNPGTTPTISADILIPVSTTFYPVPVDHLGNTNVADLDLDLFPDGDLDALDDRLYAAHIRNGRLWTAHNIAVNASGVGTAYVDGSNTVVRNGVRWYELNVPVGSGTPTVVQSGTVFNNAATRATARQFWIPTVMVSGQGHAAIGYSTAGTTFRADAATNGRLRTDTLGTTGAVNIYTATAGAYNPPSDPGTPGFGRRWGDYSFTSLDPKDDMTMWTIQEFCDANNSYGVRIAKLLAPPPASPSSVNVTNISPGLNSVLVNVTGTSVSGSEFYDPGANLAPPALPFNHISATVSGGVTVNSVTYTDPTHITLDLNTVAAAVGLKNITVTNPDGQSATTNNVIGVGVAPPSPILISEFRFRGSAGGNDEFIELYNNTDSPITVADTNGGAGYAVAGTNNVGVNSNRCTVPNNTVIPARGHFLCTNNASGPYSLGGYATADASYTTGIGDSGGVAVFSTTTAASWSTNTRFDAVGFQGITGTTLFTEGAGLLPSVGLGTTNGEYSFVRKMTRASNGLPQDTNDNQNDFAFVSTTGAPFGGRQSTLGAPGPENTTSPLNRNGLVGLTLLDPSKSSSVSPNRDRDPMPDAANNSTFGTLTIRRTVTNNTAANITRLRFRIVDITTSAGTVPAGTADLRARTSPGPTVINITGTNPACPAGVCTVQALTLESPPSAANNGGLNSSLSAGTVTVTPILPGGQINVQFLLGIQQTGTFRFLINVEALP